MSVINKLPEEVANQISAGEVVERPASVVKELIENSIDADSTQILIEVKNGGKKEIRIKDNGYGISGDELEKAFDRYATSKIEGINDLYSIRTLGFRGEALASIASVSEVEISSRHKEKEKGYCLKLKGGKKIEKKPTGIPPGTNIIIRNLFYNTPARYKYLKKTTTEFGHISTVVQREALAYPHIKFILKHNKKEVLKTPGTGELKDIIRSIYGRELTKKLLNVNFKDRYIHLNGYIALPEYNRSSRIYEIFFVNNRAVKNNILNRGVEAGYKGLLPPGRYPVVFINIELNRILVDVNVHPTKREIKFSRNQVVKDVLQKGVKKTLSSNTVNLTPGIKIKKDDKNINRNSKNNINKKQNMKNKKYSVRIDKNNIDVFKEENESIDLKKQKLFFENSRDNSINEKKLYKKDNQKKICSDNKISYNKNQINYQENEAHNIDNISEIKQKEININKILGQYVNTYIIAEGTEGIYFIDQHNAHERILYDKLYKKYNTSDINSQSLLVPVQIETTLDEMEMIKKYQKTLNKMGIKIEGFGGKTFVVQEIPVLLKNRSSKELINELIDNLFKNARVPSSAELIKKAISYMACRGAIKAGQKLESSEIVNLIEKLLKTKNPYRCPHGRPIMSLLKKKDIEKALGR